VLVYTGLYNELESQVDGFGDSESQTVSLTYSVGNLPAGLVHGQSRPAASGSRVIATHQPAGNSKVGEVQ